MLNIKLTPQAILTDLTGKNLMTVAQLNKGTAFTQSEREMFGLNGKLPAQIETLEEQVMRAYQQFSRYQTDMQKHIYLNNLHDKNQVLFYKLISEHLTEMVPLIYTPCIATAVEEYSQEFRQPRGLFIAYEDRHNLDNILDNRTNPDIDLIVVTDGEGVLGIGDQGVGSINIPIAKLMIYTLFGGINPLRTLPIYLDTGTNNKSLLNNPFYLGQRHPRISRIEYDDFIDIFVTAIQKKFPCAFLHWEDFGRNNAYRILENYQHKICTFNDDIQGTGAVALSAILSGIKKSAIPINNQRIIIFGAGTAGIGIADQIYRALIKEGLSPQTARDKFWLIDKEGLVIADNTDLTTGQRFFARHDITQKQSLLETVQLIKPTILIGCSSQAGAFSENIIKTMANLTNMPIIFCLSNPTDHAEAHPADLIKWTNARALIATGSPFPPVIYQDKIYPIAQCNNALIFPGIGLGILAVRAKLLSDNMLYAAAKILAEFSGNALLPVITDTEISTLAIAKAVAAQAMAENLAAINIPAEDLESYIKKMMWKPAYQTLKYENFR